MSNPKGNEATLRKFTPKWNNTETKVIRVPVLFADRLLEIAQQLDDSKRVANSHVTVNERAINLLKEALILKPNAGGAIKAKIKEALQILN